MVIFVAQCGSTIVLQLKEFFFFFEVFQLSLALSALLTMGKTFCGFCGDPGGKSLPHPGFVAVRHQRTLFVKDIPKWKQSLRFLICKLRLLHSWGPLSTPASQGLLFFFPSTYYQGNIPYIQFPRIGVRSMLSSDFSIFIYYIYYEFGYLITVW